MTYLVPMLLGCLAVLAGPILAIASSPPSADAPVLVVAWPWNGGAEAVVTKAGGYTVGPEQGRIAVIATSFDEEFTDRLRNAGAAIVVDGTRMAQICGDAR